ncbi:hypothetical protein BOQ64_16265 [Chryseobacterium sp. CH25]|nr:hypothetical protein BOQ64_16265 [Chryseobacterium sp. CH25]
MKKHKITTKPEFISGFFMQFINKSDISLKTSPSSYYISYAFRFIFQKSRIKLIYFLKIMNDFNLLLYSQKNRPKSI